ncbi:MAG: M48 family metalloprotease [Halobacteriota archaeon]|nr:M48 family metalloprotease [Halobacteriota archaeon]
MDSIIRLLLLWILATLGLTVIGWFGGNRLGFGFYGPVIMLEFVTIITMFIYFSSDKVLLRWYRAKQMPQEHNSYKIVDELARKIDIPTPKLFVAEMSIPTIFAVGRNSRHASIVLTSSLIDLLDEEELGAVVAHEMYHIDRGDTFVSTVVAAVAGIPTILINSTSVFFGFFVATLVAPPAALVIKLTMPLSREHFADLKSVDIFGKAEKLSSALYKIQERLDSNNYKVNPSHVHLFILNPLHYNRLKLLGLELPTYNRLFNTHPPINERLNMLKSF